MNQILESTNKVYKSYKNSIKCKPSWGCQMIGKRIQSARKASGLSLRKLGEEVGVSHAAIKKYEDGLVIPTSLILLKLAKVLGVRTEYFFRHIQARIAQLEAYQLGTGEVLGSNLAIPTVGKGCERDST